MDEAQEATTECFCNGVVTRYFKFYLRSTLSFRGTGRGLDKAPLQKHKCYPTTSKLCLAISNSSLVGMIRIFNKLGKRNLNWGVSLIC